MLLYICFNFSSFASKTLLIRLDIFLVVVVELAHVIRYRQVIACIRSLELYLVFVKCIINCLGTAQEAEFINSHEIRSSVALCGEIC